METYRTKQTQKQKEVFTAISRGFVTPIKRLTVNKSFTAYQVTMLKALMNERTKEGTMVAHLYHISDPGAFGVKCTMVG